jgi:hypothetical protein
VEWANFICGKLFHDFLFTKKTLPLYFQNLIKFRIMATIEKRPAKKVCCEDARHRIKPRGLRGMYKDILITIGDDDEVFSLNRLAKVRDDE